MTEANLPPNTKLTFEKAAEIRQLLASGKKRPELAKQFGVSETTIKRIQRNQAWK